MPVGRARQQHRLVGLQRQAVIGFGDGLGHRLPLDLLTLLVEPIELGGDAARLDLVVRQQKPRAQSRVADAAAGIDARP